MKTIRPLLLVVALSGAALQTHADVVPNPLFADNAVLQQGVKLPVWGTADPKERVTVEIAGQTVSATTGSDGRWKVYLKPLKPGGPHLMKISGRNTIAIANLLVGEVWICSGQSNMERHLGLQGGQKPIVGWEQEARDANYPEIRQFYVVKKIALSPESTAKGDWSICSPETVKDFTAVGYFFGRDLHKARKVPIGLIHTSWGGTPAEAWTSEGGLRGVSGSAGTLEDLARFKADPDRAMREYETKLDAWFRATDPGSAGGTSWSGRVLDVSAWKSMTVPTLWESAGEPDLDGVVWFRKAFDLPESFISAPAELELGMVDDIDNTWVNGVAIGGMNGYNLPRKYSVSDGVLKPGRNVIAVRVLDTGGGGGIYGDRKMIRLTVKGSTPSEPINLSGPWQYRIGVNFRDGRRPPANTAQSSSTPTVLYNGMIAPLVPYAIRGVIWYQGEANVGRERQYRSLFPAMIDNWRDVWDQGDFPFLFVQIAPYRGMSPEIREAQLLTWERTKKTAMVVTTDCGDANDIHPANKRPVGERLALAARAIAYGEMIEYSGPLFESMSVKGSDAVLHFTHLSGGLVAKDGPLRGFAMSGVDGIFLAAKAEILGDTVVVHSDVISNPVSVRYSWANVPDGNLFNNAGLPATPFRTDVD